MGLLKNALGFFKKALAGSRGGEPPEKAPPSRFDLPVSGSARRLEIPSNLPEEKRSSLPAKKAGEGSLKSSSGEEKRAAESLLKSPGRTSLHPAAEAFAAPKCRKHSNLRKNMIMISEEEAERLFKLVRNARRSFLESQEAAANSPDWPFSPPPDPWPQDQPRGIRAESPEGFPVEKLGALLEESLRRASRSLNIPPGGVSSEGDEKPPKEPPTVLEVFAAAMSEAEKLLRGKDGPSSAGDADAKGKASRKAVPDPRK